MMDRLKRFLDPFIVLLVGTVALASTFPARGVFAPIFDTAASVGIILLFFIHGAKLSRASLIAGGRNIKLQGAVLAMTFVVFPLVGMALSSLSMLPEKLAIGFLFLCLLPSTVQSSIALTAIAKGNVASAVCAATFSNFLGIFFTPVLVGLVLGRSGDFSIVDSMQKIVLNLLLPFIAGHLARPIIGSFIQRHKPLTTIVDRGSILLVVYAAFGAAVVDGIWGQVDTIDMFWLVLHTIVLLGIIQLIIFGLAHLLKFSHEDKMVLLMCGSVKSLAAGVPMAGVLFPGAAVGGVILPLMIFHQLQLITCAIIARRYSRIIAEDARLAPG